MWKTLSSKKLFSHPRLTLIEDDVLLPNGLQIKYLKFEDDGHSVATIIAKRADGKILLQKECSYPFNQKIFQFPGGHVPAGENPEVGANRELMEEAGLRGNKMELLGTYLVSNRRSKAKMYIYLATDLHAESLEKDLEEEIESFWFEENEITKMIAQDKIINCHALSGWCLYQTKKNNQKK